MRNVLVTGAAGFIGFYLSKRLLEKDYKVTGVDNLNDYYDVALKNDRLRQVERHENFRFLKADISDRNAISDLLEREKFDIVVNLAAQAGVRYSLVNPHAYIESNISGFLNVLEGSRKSGVGHVVFASSSSVYGSNATMPFSVHDNTDHPVSLYGATKKSNELMAHAYASLYSLPCTGLRFFTVYGPWGRPDMAYFLFTKSIIEGRPIDVFNEGRMKRDFTYIDDAVEGVVRVMDKAPSPDPDWNGSDPSGSCFPYKIYNVGNNQPIELLRFIEVIEESLGMKARKNFLPMQPGDVTATYADIDEFASYVGFRPGTPIDVGIGRFVQWYREYYA